LVTLPANDIISTYLRGSVIMDGVVTMPGGDTAAISGRWHIPDRAFINNPNIQGQVNFQNASGAAAAKDKYATGNSNQYILRSGTTLRVGSSDGNVEALPVSTGGFHVADGYLGIKDGITAPSAVSGMAVIYVDTADGDLKVKFADGTVKTLATDT
jgi:hypothetical protein